MNYKIFRGANELGEISSNGEINFSGDIKGIEPITDRFSLFLSNALPEGERYENMLLNSPMKEFSQVDHAASLDELPGDISIGAAEHRAIVPFPALENSPVVVRTDIPSDMFLLNSESRKHIKPSFSGYQDKFTAKIVIENGEPLVTTVDSRMEIGNTIVKPGIRFPFIAENEFICMKLAERAGLDVPNVFLIRHPDEKWKVSHFCAERFDFNSSQEPITKKMIAEFASLVGLNSKNKYLLATEELFEAAENFLNKDDIQKFGTAYLFGFIVGNGDMHTKNFSVFVDGDKYRMTPIYDMLNTKMYDFKDSIALPFGENSTKNPPVENFLEFIERYVSNENIIKLAKNMKEQLPDIISLVLTDGDDYQKNGFERRKMLFCKELENRILEKIDDVERTILERVEVK